MRCSCEQRVDQRCRHRPPRLGGVGKLDGQGVADDVAVDPFHDVEPGADHRLVLAEGDHLGHRDSGALQRREHAVLARHVVRGGEHVRERRPANHETALAVVDDVREVRASAGDHLAAQRARKSSDARRQVRSERVEVEPRRRRHCGGGGCP